MTTSDDPASQIHDPEPAPPTVKHRPRGHGWMMIALCVPILAIAIVLVTTGVVKSGVLLVAVACIVMMALMMRGMGHGDRGM